MDPRRRKLNDHLQPKDFKIRIRSSHHLVLNDWGEADDEPSRRADAAQPGRLQLYLQDLGIEDATQRIGTTRLSTGEQWIALKGPEAVEHARRVHAKLRRHFLRFEDVNAVDIGFAVKNGRFDNLLAIRIHLGTKRPVTFLEHRGLPNFTHVKHFIRAARGFGVSPSYAEGVRPDDLGLVSYGDEGEPSYEMEDYIRSLPKIGEPQQTQPAQPGPGKTAAKATAGAGNAAPVFQCACCKRPCGRRCDCGECCICCDCPRGGPVCDLCPKNCRLTLCGVPIDIVEANYFPSMHHPGGDAGDGVFVDQLKPSGKIPDKELLLTGRGKVSPLVGGVSIGGPNGQAGTLGVVVWDETDGTPCILGNWHVLAGSTRAERGQPCYQPALFDGGCTDDVIAHLKRWHLGELGDAAIAELDGNRQFASGEILGLWHPISGYQRPTLNLEIRKWGRTSGFTEGFVDGIHLATDLDFGGFIRHFENQFHIAPLRPSQDVSQPGDSGALIIAKHDLDDLEHIAEAVLHEDRQKLEALLEGEERCPNTEAAARAIAEQLGEGDASKLALKLARTVLGAPSGRKEGIGLRLERFVELLAVILRDQGIDLKQYIHDKIDRKNREARNIYYAVGMIFAGDTPGSPFGEFALASPIEPLAEELRFSLRPVFEPRSSFRKLRPGISSPTSGRRSQPGAVDRQTGSPATDSRAGGGPQGNPQGNQSTGPGTYPTSG